MRFSASDGAMNFCSACGARVSLRVPPGDRLPRHVCDACGTIHYRNPRMVVGALPIWQDRILLCRRAIEPRLGYWTLPAGFMEVGETTAQAAIRETLEEANARIGIGSMYTLCNVAHVDQVHIFYLAQLVDLGFSAGEESLDVALFDEAQVPWDEIAFRSVRFTLERFFADRALGRYGFHTHDIPALQPGAASAHTKRR